MSTSPLQAQYQLRAQGFLFHFQALQHLITEYDTHQVRVQIKRMRSLLLLMEQAGEESFKKKKHFRLFKKLFATAGVLRECHINQALIEKQSDESAKMYSSYLSGVEDQAAKQLRDELGLFKLDKFHRLNEKLSNKLVNLDQTAILSNIRHFIDEKSTKIDCLLEEIDDKKLHKIRFHLKAVVEVYKIINSLITDAAIQQKELKLKEIEQLIGDWHDLHVLIGSVTTYHQKTIAAGLDDLIKQLVLTNESSKESIIEKIRISHDIRHLNY